MLWNSMEELPLKMCFINCLICCMRNPSLYLRAPEGERLCSSYKNYKFFIYIYVTHVCTHICGERDTPRLNIYISVKQKFLERMRDEQIRYKSELTSFNNFSTGHIFEMNKFNTHLDTKGNFLRWHTNSIWSRREWQGPDHDQLNPPYIDNYLLLALLGLVTYYIKYNLSNCKAWVDFVILFCRYNLKIKKSKKEMHFARVTAGNYEQFALKHCWIRNTVITHLFAQLTLGIRLNDSASFRLSWHMKDGRMGFCLLSSFLLFFIGISTAQMAYIIGSDAGNKTQAKSWLNIQATSKLLDFKVAL